MADAIGVLSFALHAAHKLYITLESIKDAPNEIQVLGDHALQVHNFLNRVLSSQEEGAPRIGNIEDPQIDSLVKRAQRIKATVDKFISKTTIQKDDGSHEVKKLKWPLYAGKAKELSEQFAAFYHSLTAAYTVSTSATVAAVRSDLARHEILLQAIYTLVTLQDAAQQQRQVHSMRSDELHAMYTRLPPTAFRTGPLAESSSANFESPRADLVGTAENNASRETDTNGSNGVHTNSHARAVGARFPESLSLEADGCTCACRSDICPIPSSLNSWLGRLNIPRALAASLLPSLFPCTDPRCSRNKSMSESVRYYMPPWSAVEASIWFKAFPIHFCIQTPRVVPSLRYLYEISFDDFRRKLSSRQLTIFDVEPGGQSILHRLLQREQNFGDAFDLITYVLDAGIPHDWQVGTMTAVEWAAHLAQLTPALRTGSRSLDLNIVRPLFHSSLDETAETLDRKLKRSGLHTFLLRPQCGLPQSLDMLRRMLALPDLRAQINTADVSGYTPLYYAIRTFPEAVELLLRAGASPRDAQDNLLHQAGNEHWKAVSPLIRAGYPTHERDFYNFGNSTLHSIAADPHPSYRHALELIRHGGHRLEWAERDDNGYTPLDVAAFFANQEPDNIELLLIRDVYCAQSIPPHAQYISSFDGERLMSAQEAATHPRISLIESCLAGDITSIGPLISAGAMVNERDEEGRTLLHLIAAGDRVPHGYQVALELERHGGFGIDYWATYDGKTAHDIARETLLRSAIDEDARKDVTRFLEYLDSPDPQLPVGEQYVFPCIDPAYCFRCCSLRCSCIGYDVPDIPGTFRS